ncbi:MAG: carbon-nitrogen hydrolase family protein [Betaproteobacteria bacterium]|nr:carbon-nitrogen hydrolase family protein [Betaproteobacteria bacterium]
MTRIACVQLSLVADEAANLEKCLGLIDAAAAARAELVVLPEMSNWSGGLVRSRAEAIEHGTTIPGPFLDALAERAERHGCFVAAGVIERLGGEAFITSAILAPDRRIVLKYQKQIPFSAQRVWASPGRTGNPVVQLPFGRVGIYICADGLVPETARALALQGAHLLLNTLHSGGADETRLHVPARAVENRVWVASANKVGERELGAIGAYCGGSQIVSPTGEIVARADDHSDTVVWADVDLTQAEDKVLGGDDIFLLRRPECYRALVAPPGLPDQTRGPATLGVAALQPTGYGDSAVDEAVRAWREAAAAGAKLMVLPGFFPYEPAAVAADPDGAAADGERYLARLREVARGTATWGVASMVEREGDRCFHTGFLVGHRGEIAGRYRQVHVPAALSAWATPGSALEVFDTPIGRIGILCGADALVPEAFRVLAYCGAQVIALASQWRAEYEIDLVMPERAAENRVNIVFARRFDSPVSRGSAIIGVVPYPSEPHWKVRSPDVVEARPGARFVVSGINLAATRDKTIGPQGCDLMASALPAEYGILAEVNPRGSRE